MVFDTLKRLLGLENSSSRDQSNSASNPSTTVDERIVPFRNQLPPDISQIESEFAHINDFMEQQMRTMMGSFGFMFGSPFAGFGFGDDVRQEPIRSSPFSSGDFGGNIIIPESPQADSSAMDPRDAVLKPQFRSKTPNKWKGQDQILDERFEAEGPSSVLDVMKPLDNDFEKPVSSSDSFSKLFESGLFRNGPFGSSNIFSFGSTPEMGSVMSSSTVTIYSNVNGHKSVEKIITHPDGKIERTVISDDGRP